MNSSCADDGVTAIANRAPAKPVAVKFRHIELPPREHVFVPFHTLSKKLRPGCV
jgi:hypothetical protein